MRVFLLVFHLLVTLVLIGVILVQRGEDAGAGGGSGGLPGARSGKNPLTRVTAVLATIFFADCLGMAILIREESQIGTTSVTKNETTSIKPSSKALPVMEAKQAPVVLPVVANDQKNTEKKPDVNLSGGTSGVKSPVVSKARPVLVPKSGTVSQSKSKTAKSTLKKNSKAKRKSKDLGKKAG
jgi:protein translocase SecG subunit